MEHVRQAAEAIERNALRQSRLVDDLLDVNRISRGTFSLDRGVHELSGLLRAAVETSAHDVESKSIRLEAVYPDEALSWKAMRAGCSRCSGISCRTP